MKKNKLFVRWTVLIVVVLAFVAPAILVGANSMPYLPDRPILFDDQMVGRVMVYHDGKYQEEEVQMEWGKNFPEDIYFDEGVTYFHVGTHPDIEWGIDNNGSSYNLEDLSDGWYKIDVYDLSEYPSIFFVELKYD